MTNTSGYKSGLLFILFLLAVSSLSSCIATLKEGDATLAFYQKAKSTTSATTGIGAFTDTFYGFARTNCVACHGGTQSPLFATGDVNASYAASLAYANFSSPSASKLSVYAGNAHCGAAGCSGNSSTAADLIQQWADVENAASAGSGAPVIVIGGGPSTGTVGAGSLVSISLAIPANLPTGQNYLPMRWELSQLSPSSGLVSGALFELEIQSLSSTTYRVRNPKIVGLSAVTKITGIHVLVKPSSDPGYGVEDLGAGSVWESDVVNVAASTRPAPLPAGALSTATFPPLDSFSMVIGIRSNQDSLTIAFDGIASGAAVMPTFASINANILQTKCVNCHNANNKLGGKSFASYTDTLMSVVAGNPAGSALFTSVAGASPTMPIGSLKLTAQETGAISTWIMNGAPNN